MWQCLSGNSREMESGSWHERRASLLRLGVRRPWQLTLLCCRPTSKQHLPLSCGCWQLDTLHTHGCCVLITGTAGWMIGFSFGQIPSTATDHHPGHHTHHNHSARYQTQSNNHWRNDLRWPWAQRSHSTTDISAYIRSQSLVIVSRSSSAAWARGDPPLSVHLPTFYSIFLVSFTFPFTRFIYFLAFPSLPILPE